jgi:hypothetical protein
MKINKVIKKYKTIYFQRKQITALPRDMLELILKILKWITNIKKDLLQNVLLLTNPFLVLLDRSVKVGVALVKRIR